jgi:hypothetical protein
MDEQRFEDFALASFFLVSSSSQFSESWGSASTVSTSLRQVVSAAFQNLRSEDLATCKELTPRSFSLPAVKGPPKSGRLAGNVRIE